MPQKKLSKPIDNESCTAYHAEISSEFHAINNSALLLTILLRSWKLPQLKKCVVMNFEPQNCCFVTPYSKQKFTVTLSWNSH